ncbi:hypothetical protein NQ314_007883 [Rhamnusium bicolor]|uniref:Uncharacterized protein n=1 Tax=Rhamnusium bicolor TaxID=1586634 RepID=A0AAV8YF96_9CUCU|nr:hypothetical protein NQ314_007883 [Rhamnusium bicolor]
MYLLHLLLMQKLALFSPSKEENIASGLDVIEAQAAQGAQGGYGQPGGFAGGFGGSFGSGNDGTYQGGYSGPEGGSFSFPIPQGGEGFSGYGPSSGGASATASFGPGGIQQTASVYPENPNSPNINTRFGGSEAGGQPGGGFHSVFTSSQSQSANVNGKPVTLHKASTTVNDNGKITTYTANNP